MRVPDLWLPPDTPFTASDVGRSAHVLERAVRDGRIVRLRRGVYIGAGAVPPNPTGQHLLLALAQQRTRPGLVASHGTAALAHGLLVPWTSDITGAEPRFIMSPAPGRRSVTQPRIAVRVLPKGGVVALPSGLRATTWARTAVDLASEQGLPEALVTLDSAARAHALDLAGTRWLRSASDRVLRACKEPLVAAVPTVPRHARRRTLEAISYVDPRRESATESLSAGAFTDLADNAFAGISGSTRWNFSTGSTDTSAPQIVSLTPADDSGNVSRGANLVIVFNETVRTGSGNLHIRDAQGQLRTIAVTDTSQVTIDNSTVTINPTADLAVGANYTVTIEAGAFRDLAGNNHPCLLYTSPCAVKRGEWK